MVKKKLIFPAMKASKDARIRVCEMGAILLAVFFYFAGIQSVIASEFESDQGNSSPRPTVKFDIFGSEYERIEIVSSALQGTVYYLVSGHGGPDPGAVAKYNGKTLCEDEYAYDITLRLARVLISHGAKVYMVTRDMNDGIRDSWYLAPDKDERVYPNQKIPAGQTERLQQRISIVNKLYVQNKSSYQRLVEIHIDSRSKGNGTDVFFYYNPQSVPGKRLAESLRGTMANKYEKHQPGRGYNGTVSARSLFMLRHTYPVASFIELGNIHHERDVKRLILVKNRQALAQWLAEGLIKDYKANKKR
jgi:N-acetylmuramoyl-L-alanine amidase